MYRGVGFQCVTDLEVSNIGVTHVKSSGGVLLATISMSNTTLHGNKAAIGGGNMMIYYYYYYYNRGACNVISVSIEHCNNNSGASKQLQGLDYLLLMQWDLYTFRIQYLHTILATMEGMPDLSTLNGVHM